MNEFEPSMVFETDEIELPKKLLFFPCYSLPGLILDPNVCKEDYTNSQRVKNIKSIHLRI